VCDVGGVAATALNVGATTAIVQNVVLTVCGIATVVIAVIGLSAWRRQLKGTSAYARAKDLLKAVYRVRRAFAHVRHPAIYQHEYPAGSTDSLGRLKPECEYEGTAFVYNNRLQVLETALRELDEQNLEAEVEWGSEFQDTMAPIRKCVADVQWAIYTMLEDKKGLPVEDEESMENRTERRSILYALGEDSTHNRFTREINAAVAVFEDKLRPLIAPR